MAQKRARFEIEYLGYKIKTINHELFGINSVKVFAIKLGKIIKESTNA